MSNREFKRLIVKTVNDFKDDTNRMMNEIRKAVQEMEKKTII